MDEKQKIDFICVGFQKCGTTLLQELLKQNDDIYLSDRKETWFFEWKDYYKNPLEKLKRDFFFDVPTGRKVGIVDPTFIYKPRGIRNYFGRDCKIIIMVRNPVDMAYSNFKMKLRTCQGENILPLYRRYSSDINKMFSAYLWESMRTGQLSKRYYTSIIKKYYEYFKKENIYIIVLESLLQNREIEMRNLERFLGVKNNNYSFEKVNEGNLISKNYFCACINRAVFAFHMKLYPRLSSQNIRDWWYELRGAIFNLTQTQFDGKIDQKSMEKLQQYWEKEKYEMEKITHKELNTLWF